MSQRILLLKFYYYGEVIDVAVFVRDGIVVKSKGFVNKDICNNNMCIDLRSYGIALPGFIDIHTHLRGLNLSYKEDEETGTMAAARGGFTAVIDMPNTIPRIDNIDALENKIRSLREKAYVDYGIYISPSDRISRMNLMLDVDGVIGVKIFPEDLKYIDIVLEILRRRNFDKLMIVHAEHPDYISECEAGLRWRCRSIDSELAALRILGELSRHGDRIHVTHVTNTAVLQYAKNMGFSIDTCPHYLYLSSEDERILGCIAKVNPPLREPSIRDELLRSIKMFDAISTDHAPHSIEEKSKSFDECPAGIPSLDIAGSLILNLIHMGFLSIDDVIKLTSLGPAKVIGIDRWGCIHEGCVASYTIVDLTSEIIVDPNKFYSKAKFSPYRGRRLRGVVKATVVRGYVVFRNDDLDEKPVPEPLTKFMVRKWV